MWAKGRAYASWANKFARKPYENVYMALELAEQAYEAHGLAYNAGLSSLEDYPPDRFTWVCDESGDPKQCVKVCDDKTGSVVVWPHWSG
jgi:hypothetical protein